MNFYADVLFWGVMLPAVLTGKVVAATNLFGLCVPIVAPVLICATLPMRIELAAPVLGVGSGFALHRTIITAPEKNLNSISFIGASAVRTHSGYAKPSNIVTWLRMTCATMTGAFLRAARWIPITPFREPLAANFTSELRFVAGVTP